jgi:hypothetical protein
LTAAQTRRLAGVVQRLHTIGASYAQLQALEQPGGDRAAKVTFVLE